jgi:hypothetical protein
MPFGPQILPGSEEIAHQSHARGSKNGRRIFQMGVLNFSMRLNPSLKYPNLAGHVRQPFSRELLLMIVAALFAMTLDICLP